MGEALMPISPIGDGGGGGPSEQKKDAELIRRAVKERWPIPPDIRQAVPEYLGAIVAGCEDPRARVSAARALVEMDKVNQEQERREAGLPDPNSPPDGRTAPPVVSITLVAADIAAARGLLGMEGRDLHLDGGPQPVDSGRSEVPARIV